MWERLHRTGCFSMINHNFSDGLEGREEYSRDYVHGHEGLKQQGTAGVGSSQPVLYYLRLQFNLNQDTHSLSLSLSQGRKALLACDGKSWIIWW